MLLFFFLETAFRPPPEKEFDMTDEQRLLYKLMENYDNSVRPVMKASSPVVIQLGITLTQIMDIVSTFNVYIKNNFTTLIPDSIMCARL